MKHINHTCKFCGKPITLRIAMNYCADEDPMKLIPLGACDRCAELRVTRRLLNDAIAKVIAQIRTEKNSAIVTSCRAALTTLTKRYVRMVAEWTNRPMLQWDETIVDAIMQDPESCGEVLSRVWPAKMALTHEMQ